MPGPQGTALAPALFWGPIWRLDFFQSLLVLELPSRSPGPSAPLVKGPTESPEAVTPPRGQRAGVQVGQGIPGGLDARVFAPGREAAGPGAGSPARALASPTRGSLDIQASATLRPRRRLGVSARSGRPLPRAGADRGASPAPPPREPDTHRSGLFLAAGRPISQDGGGGRRGESGGYNYSPGQWAAWWDGAGRPLGPLRGAPAELAWLSPPGERREERAPPGGGSPGSSAPVGQSTARGLGRVGLVYLHSTWIEFRTWSHGLEPPRLYIFSYLLRLSLHLSPYLLLFFHLLIPFSPLLQSLFSPINLVLLQDLSPLEIRGVNK